MSMQIEKIIRKFYFIMLRKPSRSIRLWALRRLGFSIGKDVYVGDNLTMTVGVADKNIQLILEDRVSVAPNVTLVLASRANNSKLNKILPNPERKIVIRHDSWIGTGAVIMPGVEIGEFCIVGAGSIVLHDVPAYTVVAGNPARVIRTIDKSTLE